MKVIKDYLIGIFSFVILMVICIFILSLIFAYTNIDDRFIDTGIYISFALCGFLSSIILTKNIKKQGLIHGIVINIIGILILFIISSIINGGVQITNTLWIYLGICSLSGVIGGIVGVNV